MTEDRSQFRLWMMGAAIALLLHGVAVVAVLRWHKAPPTEPVMIDLAPSPTEPSLQSSLERVPESSLEPSAEPSLGASSLESSLGPSLQQSNAAPALPPSSERIQANGAAQESIASAGPALEAQAATNGGGGAELVSPPHGLLAPRTSPPSENTEQESGAAKNMASGGGAAPRAAPNAGIGTAVSAPVPGPIANVPVGLGPVVSRTVVGAAKNPTTGAAVSNGPVANSPLANAPTARDPFANSPIDTSITVQPGPSGKRGLAAIEHQPSSEAIGQKSGVLFRPARIGEPEHLPSGGVLPGATSTRAVGAHVQDHARAAAARRITAIGSAESPVVGNGVANAAGNITTTAIGTAESGAAGKGGWNPAGTVATNAIGIPIRALAPEKFSAAPAAERGTNSVATAGPRISAVINGRAIIRPGSGPAGIGGPTGRAASGALNGTDFHAKTP